MSVKSLIVEFGEKLGPENRKEIHRQVEKSHPGVSYVYVCNVIRQEFSALLGPPRVGRKKLSGVVPIQIDLDDSLRDKLDAIIRTRKHGRSHASVIKNLIRECDV